MKAYEIVGMQKICSDVDQAMKRANAQRFDIQTPCQKTGSCLNCLSPDTVWCQFFITRYSRHQSHIRVILVNNHLGF